MKSYKNLKKRLLQDKATKHAYNKLGAEFQFIELIIQKRIKEGLTQADLAKKVGT